MEERKQKNSQKKMQELSFKGVQTYVKNYAKNCKQSYLRLLSI